MNRGEYTYWELVESFVMRLIRLINYRHICKSTITNIPLLISFSQKGIEDDVSKIDNIN